MMMSRSWVCFMCNQFCAHCGVVCVFICCTFVIIKCGCEVQSIRVTSTWEMVRHFSTSFFSAQRSKQLQTPDEIIIMLDVVVALATLGIWAYGVWSIPKCIACIDGARRRHGNSRNDSRVVVIEETTATFATIYPMAERAVRISSKADLLDESIHADSEVQDVIPEAKLVEPVKVYTHRSFWM